MVPCAGFCDGALVMLTSDNSKGSAMGVAAGDRGEPAVKARRDAPACGHGRFCGRGLPTAVLAAVIAISVGALVVRAQAAAAAIGHGFISSLTEAPPGTPLDRPDAVAVDRSSGNVFVGDSGSGTVDVYTATGAFLTQFIQFGATANGGAVVRGVVETVRVCSNMAISDPTSAVWR